LVVKIYGVNPKIFFLKGDVIVPEFVFPDLNTKDIEYFSEW